MSSGGHLLRFREGTDPYWGLEAQLDLQGVWSLALYDGASTATEVWSEGGRLERWARLDVGAAQLALLLSRDGVFWTAVYSQSTPASFATRLAAYPQLGFGTWDTTPPQSASFDDFAAWSGVGHPNVITGVHLYPDGIASTAAVPTGAVVRQAGVLRTYGIPSTATLGQARVPAYLRPTGITDPDTIGQPTLIRQAPILAPQARVEIQWRFILCDINGAPLEDISPIAVDRQLSYRLNRPEVCTFRIPSDHPLVNETAPDGLPNLAVLRRVLKAYRAERTPTGDVNVLRFVGWIWQLQDQGDADNAWTDVTCFGPMQRLMRRVCVDASGSQTSATWTATDGGQIVHSMLSQLNAGATWAHTGVDVGTREATDIRTVDLTNMSIAAAIVQLTSAFNGFDVYFAPLDRRDGHLARLDVVSRRGTHRSQAILGWGIPPHNVLESARLVDSETYANSIILQGATPETDGARPIQSTADNSTEQQAIGIHRVVESYPDVSSSAYLAALATEELGFRSKAREIVSLRLQPGRAPEPFTEWDVGDTLPLFVGARQRGGYQGVVRCYGFDIEINEEGEEIVSSLILSPEGG